MQLKFTEYLMCAWHWPDIKSMVETNPDSTHSELYLRFGWSLSCLSTLKFYDFRIRKISFFLFFNHFVLQ